MAAFAESSTVRAATSEARPAATSEVIRKGQLRKSAAPLDVNIEELRATIQQQSKYIRHLKRQGADKDTVLSEAHRLLDLKYLDPENDEVVDPKCIKIRWWMKKLDGSAVRLQVPFQSRTYVLGSEVAAAVEAYAARVAAKKQLAPFGSLLKLELCCPSDSPTPRPEAESAPATSTPTAAAATEGGRARRRVKAAKAVKKVAKPAAAAAKRLAAVLPDDRFELGIVNPGPTLEDERAFTIEATWSSAQSSPVYDLLDHVPQLIDVGVNLSDKAFAKDTANVVRRASAAGVVQQLLLSTTAADSLHYVAVAQQYARTLFVAAGIHPCWAHKAPADAIRAIDDLLTNSSRQVVVAVGEIGLDFSHKAADQLSSDAAAVDTPATADTPAAAETDSEVHVERQIEIFTAQLELAVKHRLPVIVHAREAHAQLLPILQRFRPQLTDIVIFCFSEGEAELRSYLELDCYICLTGLVCNDGRGAHLRSLIPLVPKHRLLLASDAPYLAPFSQMAKPYPKHNEPALLPYVAQALLNYAPSDTTVSELARVTTENARRLFNLPAPVFNGAKPVHSAASSSSSAAASSVASEQPAESRASAVSTLLKETASAHRNLDLDKIDESSLVRLKPGQCYFAHKDKTFVVSLQIAAVLKKQRELLGEDSAAFDALVKDLAQM